MYIVNGQIKLAGEAFWRVDNTNMDRVGMEWLMKASMLLLVEDWTHEQAESLVDRLNVGEKSKASNKVD